MDVVGASNDWPMTAFCSCPASSLTDFAVFAVGRRKMLSVQLDALFVAMNNDQETIRPTLARSSTAKKNLKISFKAMIIRMEIKAI